MSYGMFLDTPMSDDADSTLIRRGRNAVTFHDMAEFAHTLEERPLAVLLTELPDLARLSDAKFTLAIKVLRRRFEHEAEVDQEQLRVCANEVAATVPEFSIAARIREIF
jgi:hypothetical protein